MAAERFANNTPTTLNGTIDNVVTSLDVTAATGFPATGNFRIRIDNEIMLVTGVSGLTYTVTRGVEGTTATSHTDGATVTHPFTAGGLEAGIVGFLRTTVTANFTQPAVGATVSVTVDRTEWMVNGQIVFVIGGGYYAVSSITNGTTVVLQNLGDGSNAAPSASVTAPAILADAGRPHLTNAAVVATEEGTTSATYVDLATVGPSVTLVTGASVILTMQGYGYMTTGAFAGSNITTYAVSGATTVAASDGNGFAIMSPATNTGRFAWAATLLVTGLNPGTNTFKLMYRTDSGDHTWGGRSLQVTRL